MVKQYLPYTTGDTLDEGFYNESLLDPLQLVANQPKYFGVADEVAQMGDMVPIAHATKTADSAANLIRTGFDPTRKKPIPQLDDLFTPGLRNTGVFVGVGDDASDIAKMYGKGSALRGTKFGSTLVDPFVGMAPKDAIQFSRNMYGHLQGKVPAGIANTAFNLGGVQNSGIVKAIPKSKLTKFFARFLPGANIALGGASAASRFAKGQPVRAGMAATSMIPGPLGYLGLGAETVADAVVSAAEKKKIAEAKKEKAKVISKKEAVKGGAAGASTTRQKRQRGTQKQEQQRQQRSRSRAAQRGQRSRRQQRSRSRAAQRRSPRPSRPNLRNRAQGGIVSINDMIGSL